MWVLRNIKHLAICCLNTHELNISVNTYAYTNTYKSRGVVIPYSLGITNAVR